MILIVDANIVVAAIVKDSMTRKLIVFSSHELFAPAHLLDELYEHKKEILRKAGISSLEFGLLVESVFKNIEIVEENAFKPYFKKAKEAVSDVDDVPYVALALYLEKATRKACSIWSQDKRLKQQSFVRVLTTEEIGAQRL